ncbi:hypothetical protein L6164_011742 [Bauhinia variegata]|uniref:Uncharacterized protein n=1 Tax=Bauhinia variegata TaxID=167791 RepID=A0ACB9P819_BAUVA|nr:hypothetical protein L6164_011742 [Bauhinia variegata]
MEAVFSLSEAARMDFLRSMGQSSGCAYICLWSYDSLSSNRLLFLDGFYNASTNQPSTSSVITVGQSLFNQFRGLAFDINDNHVPGLAIRTNRNIELQQGDLLRLAWTEIQKQNLKILSHYSDLQTAVFMGSNKGEIELGFSTMSQDYVQTALRNMFPADDLSLSQQAQLIDQNPPSSSSSSLKSLSDSPEYPSLLFNIPGTSHIPETLGGVPIMQPAPVSTSTVNSPHQAAIHQALAQVTQIQFPTPESENDAMMRAILHVLSSNAPSSSTTSHHQTHQDLPYSSVIHLQSSAFKRYRPGLGPVFTSQMATNLRRQSLLKRSFALFRNLNIMRLRERSFQTTRPTSTQLHHMISERRRREKINENFRALRTLLPPGTKKDKASILTAAKETLSSLKAEIEKLSQRNLQLESVLPAKEANAEETKTSSSGERLTVGVLHVPESSSSQERMVDLQVVVRGQSTQADILSRLLEFIRQDRNVSLISIHANTHMAEGTALNHVHFRLRIEESDWDESAFQEAVRRVVADLAQ